MPTHQKIPHICTSKGGWTGTEEVEPGEEWRRCLQSHPAREPGSSRWCGARDSGLLAAVAAMKGAMEGPWLAPSPLPSLAAPGWKQQYQRSQRYWWGNLASCSPSSWGGAYDLGDSRCMEAPTTLVLQAVMPVTVAAAKHQQPWRHNCDEAGARWSLWQRWQRVESALKYN